VYFYKHCGKGSGFGLLNDKILGKTLNYRMLKHCIIISIEVPEFLFNGDLFYQFKPISSIHARVDDDWCIGWCKSHH
jgi:hypothetical protein